MLALFTVAVVGCGLLTQTPVPQAPVVVNGVTNQPPPLILYSVPQKLNDVSNVVQQYTPVVQTVLAATPAAPLAPVLPTVENYVFGGLAGLLGLLAAYKNRQAQSHAAAAKAMAQTIAAISNATPLAMQNAIKNGSAVTVATHLDNAAQ